MKHPVFATLASCTLLALLGAGSASALGNAYYNHDINWKQTSDLSFTVASGPANTCGDLVINRNGGGYQTTIGWLCTDASGNAVKGPWSWANQSQDETAISYIRWPDGSTTNSVSHIWDKSAPTASITPTIGAPPPSFSGTANDHVNGACFSASWSTSGDYKSYARFHDITTDGYWQPGLTGYTARKLCRPATGVCDYPIVDVSISGMPSCSVSWSVSSVPPAGAHVSGHSYEWQVCVSDGSNQCGSATKPFPY
jgi:hypothetical protein